MSSDDQLEEERRMLDQSKDMVSAALDTGGTLHPAGLKLVQATLERLDRLLIDIENMGGNGG